MQSGLIIVGLIIFGFIVLGFLIHKWIKDAAEKQKPDQLLAQVLKSVDTRSLEQTKEIREQTKALNERLDNAARVISQVQKNIGEFSEIGRSLRDLQEFLRSPKLRGNLGEEVLADLIAQMFPKNSFYLQYQFKSGVKVDAAIKTDAGILPIDAKFPMENYQKMVKGETEELRELSKKEFVKDIKRHIESISLKYILPEEGTMDFAMMYVPSESVFYELVQITEVMNFSKKNRVYPVSPTTMYAHLQTILLSFAGRDLETKSREIFTLLRAMTKDYEKIEGGLGVLGKHLTNAYNQMSSVLQNFNILGNKLKSSQELEHESKKRVKIGNK